ncbi:restriction endonuclease subunit S [Streptomyces griseus]|uniref:restriction endonuclease subunit S n=1 Tax=Streptomyces griseus TaxID=1911 RepID=UPI0038197F90
MRTAEWPMRPLGEIFDIGAGKTMSAAARAGEDKVPFLRTSNVFWDRLNLTSLDEMAISSDELEEKNLVPGDLLVCEGGAIGRAAIWDGSVERISFQNHLHRLRPKPDMVDQVDPRFYVFFLQSGFTQLGIFEGAGNKTTIPNLSRNRLAALAVPFPSLAEQKAIVRSLGLVREAIDLQVGSLELAEALRRRVMADVFSKGIRGEETRESEIGCVPASWDVVEFRAIREELRYGTSKRCTLDSATYPVLRIPNILSARIDPTELKYCDMASDEAERYVLADGDLIFIRTNGVIERLGLCAVYRGTPGKALFASYLIRARLLPGVDPDFIAYFFGSDVGTSLISSRATPAADGKYNLNTGIIDSLLVPMPLLDEQEEIAAIIRACDQKTELHRKKLAVLQELYLRLLRDLMTGEITSDQLVVPGDVHGSAV